MEYAWLLCRERQGRGNKEAAASDRRVQGDGAQRRGNMEGAGSWAPRDTRSRDVKEGLGRSTDRE